MKLVEVMASVDRVAKNGTNVSQGYKYAQASDIYDAVRGELARRFVLPCPNPTKWEFSERKTNAGGTLTMCTVQGTLDFVDAETGEIMSRPMFGQGSDSLDKASYKAMTGAMKNAIVNQFLIPTGDDPENEGKVKPQLPPPAGLAGVKSKMPITTAPRTGGAEAGAVFPNYGNLKGQSIRGAPQKDLEFYANGARRTLADPAKSRFHEQERALLAQLGAELASQTGTDTTTTSYSSSGAGEPPPPTDDDRPF